MKNTKKLLSLLLAALLCAGLFWGCNETAGESSSATSQAESSVSSAVSSAASESEPASSSQVEQELATATGTVEKASKNAFNLVMEDGSSLMAIITDATEITGGPLVEGATATITYDPTTQTGLSVPAVTLELSGEGSSAETETEETELSTATGTVEKASKNAFNLVLEDDSYLMVIITDTTEVTGDPLTEGASATVTYDPTTQTGLSVPAVTIAISGQAASEPATESTTEEAASSTAEELLSSMSLEEKVGQLFFVRFPDNAPEAVSQYQFGGYILFGRDFKGLTREQVQEKIAACQAQAKVPMLMGADEEGGTVTRVSDNPNLCDEPYWSPRKLYHSGGMASVLYAEEDKCRVFRELGLNVNFAPVCDISREAGAFMYDRSLGQDAVTTSSYVNQVVNVYRQNKVGCVLKHFPGYGDNADTHTGIATDNRAYETFQQEDFLPFQSGIDAGAGCVLVAHNIVSCIDGERPASLSPEWHRILREELGFTGCIITDDLSMGAIQDFCDSGSAAVQAVLAGNDLLCCTDYEVQIPAVLDAVANGTITQARIDESALRVLRWKQDLGLIYHLKEERPL